MATDTATVDGYIASSILASGLWLNAIIWKLKSIIENGDLMTDANRKPWLTASEQIDHLKSRGVHFSLMSEDDAKAYLENNSNYFRLRVYRLGFPKVEEEVRKGVPSLGRASPIFMML